MNALTYNDKFQFFPIFVTNLNICFSCRYLSKNLVEKLEVVNKKWVRVRLGPGAYSEVIDIYAFEHIDLSLSKCKKYFSSCRA